MKIAVLIKQTPDTAELPKVTADEVKSGAVKATMVINPWDEFAAEEALKLSERFDDVDTLAISMGAPTAADALKHALAMGVGEAVLVEASNSSADIWSTAAVLAAAVKAQGGVDIVLTGKQSVDDSNGSVYVGVANKLGWPLLTNVIKVVDVANNVVTVERSVEGGQETVSAPLPAVISVSKEINEPRYPSFMGIRKANKAKIPTLSPGDLKVAVGDGKTQWANIRKPEARRTQVKIMDGATVEEKAAQLADALLAEKVI